MMAAARELPDDFARHLRIGRENRVGILGGFHDPSGVGAFARINSRPPSPPPRGGVEIREHSVCTATKSFGMSILKTRMHPRTASITITPVPEDCSRR